VHQLLTDAALGVSGVLEHPAPFVLQTRLGDFAVGYELNAHISAPIDMPRIRGDLHAAIQDAFNAAGIEIMSPTFEVRRSGPSSTVVRPDGTAADAGREA
jgi:small-conductance mechanosensitive channel